MAQIQTESNNNVPDINQLTIQIPQIFLLRIWCFGNSAKFSHFGDLMQIFLNSFSTSCDFGRLLITFANSLDPDQALENVRPDLDPNCLTL